MTDIFRQGFQNTPSLFRRFPWMTYPLAAGLTLLTLGMRVGMGGHFDNPTMVVFTIPIILSAYWGGLGPGLLSTLISVLGAAYYILPPIYSFDVLSSTQRWQEILVVLAGAVISFICHSLLGTQRSFRESEQKLRKVIDGLGPNTFLGLMTPEGILIEANRPGLEAAGLNSVDVLGLPFDQTFWWSYSDEVRVKLREGMKLAAAGESSRYDVQVLVAGDALVWIDFMLNPIRDEEGKVVYIVPSGNIIDERVKAEESVRRSESRFRSLFEYAPDGIVIADSNSFYTEANTSVCRMLGYTRDELVGLHASDIVAGSELSHIDPALALINSGSDYHREWRFRRKDGSTFPAEVIATQMPDGHLMAMIRDITERRQIDARFRRLVDSNIQGVMFWNKTGDITKANEAFLRTVGYTRGDLETGNIDWKAMTPTEYAGLDQKALQELASKGVSIPYEKEFLRKDGSRVPVLLGAAIFDDTPDEGVCFVHDITERKRTEKALRESEERFRFLNDLSEAMRKLADPSQIMAVMAGMLGKQLHASRCAYADVESDGEGFTILHDYTDGCASTVGSYQLSSFGVRAVETLQKGETLVIHNVDTELRPENGAEMFNAIGIQAIITCPLVKNGVLLAMMAVHQSLPRIWEKSEIALVEDVVERCWANIERRNAEEKVRRLNSELERRVAERTSQLEAANTELEAFSYSVSHDLRAPLRAVNGFAGMVLSEFSEQVPPEGARYLERIRKASEQMGILIDDLLAFSRLSRQPLNKHRIDMATLVQNVLIDLAPQREGREFEIRIGELPHCWGDQALLKQVWINLISNAIKYSRGSNPAVIDIGYAEEKGEGFYFVRDNGVGFDMQYVHKLFGVFQRLHRADEFEGTGVGLAIVQRIVHRLGGRIWPGSELGKGSIFSFTLGKE